MSTYKPRIADQMLVARLRRKGAVLIEGSKCDAVVYDGFDWNWRFPVRDDGVYVVSVGCLKD